MLKKLRSILGKAFVAIVVIAMVISMAGIGASADVNDRICPAMSYVLVDGHTIQFIVRDADGVGITGLDIEPFVDTDQFGLGIGSENVPGDQPDPWWIYLGSNGIAFGYFMLFEELGNGLYQVDMVDWLETEIHRVHVGDGIVMYDASDDGETISGGVEIEAGPIAVPGTDTLITAEDLYVSPVEEETTTEDTTTEDTTTPGDAGILLYAAGALIPAAVLILKKKK